MNKDYIDAKSRVFIAVHDKMSKYLEPEDIVKMTNNYMVMLYEDDYLKGGESE